MEWTQIIQIVNAGGVLAFAVVVWSELREHRKELKYTRNAIEKLGKALVVVIERERIRDGTGPIKRHPTPLPELNVETNGDGE